MCSPEFLRETSVLLCAAYIISWLAVQYQPHRTRVLAGAVGAGREVLCSPSQFLEELKMETHCYESDIF